MPRDNKDGCAQHCLNYGRHHSAPSARRGVTEYGGVADLRGQSDAEVVKRLLAVADSRFQDELVRQAKAHGKLESSYALPERYRNNLPQTLDAKLHPWTQAGLLQTSRLEQTSRTMSCTSYAR